MPDANGKKYRREIIELAAAKGKGWVDYQYKNPTTGKIEPKTTYILRVDDVVLANGSETSGGAGAGRSIHAASAIPTSATADPATNRPLTSAFTNTRASSALGTISSANSTATRPEVMKCSA